jgi:hypothetical protein
LGSIAHTYIESGLVSQFEGKGEYPVPGAGKKGYPGRVDYMREIGPNREFYEIKPITQQDENFGQVQLQNYISHAIKNGDSSAVAGTSILGDIQGMRINNVPFDLPVGDGNMSHVLGDIRMITFPGDAARKGMIYYEISNMRPNAEAYRQQFKTTLIVGGVVAGVLGLGGMLGPLPALIPALAH